MFTISNILSFLSALVLLVAVIVVWTRLSSFLRRHQTIQLWKERTAAGLAAEASGELEEAERQFRAALAAAQGLEYGSTRIATDPRLAAGFRHLARLHGCDGAFELMAEAIECARARENGVGPDHLDVTGKLERLAWLYYGIGGWSILGWRLHERIKAIREKNLGPDDLLVAESLDVVGGLYTNDKGNESGPAYRRALAIREKVLGPDHPDVAKSLENYAGYNGDDYYDLSKGDLSYEDAERLLRRALAIREGAFGTEHPDVARSLENLGDHCLYADRVAEAESLFRRALSIRERLQGPYHPDVAGTLKRVEALPWREGRYDEVENILRRVIDILKRAAGIEGPERAGSPEIFDLPLQPATAAGFERVSVTEDVVYRLRLVTDPKDGMSEVPPTPRREPWTVKGVLDLPVLIVRTPTIMFKLKHYLDDYLTLLEETGRGEEAERVRSGPLGDYMF